MQSMINLKSIKFINALSRETICFSAKVYFNGILIGEATNEGRGGSTDFSPSKLYNQIKSAHDIKDNDLIDSIDKKVYDAFNAKDINKILKRIKKDMAKKVLFFKTDKGNDSYSFFELKDKSVLNDKSKDFLSNEIKKKYPEAIILNNMNDQEIIEIIKN